MLPTSFTEAGRETDVKPDFAKQLSPTDCKEEGRFTCCNATQPEKAFAPSEVVRSDKATLASDAQSAKQLAGTAVTPSGIVNEVKTHFEKADLPNVVTPAGNSREEMAVQL